MTLAAVLLGWHGWQYLRLGARPTELRRGAGLDYRVDLNRAERAELLQLPGVGKHLAERIERYRSARGNFRHVDELRQVAGIGPALLERLRPWVCVRLDGDEEAEPLQEIVPAPARQPLPGTKKSPGKRAAALKGVVINLNRASREELQRLPGIGPKLSQRILDERARRPFASVDELRRVPGIGTKTLARLRPFLTVGDGAEHVVQGGAP